MNRLINVLWVATAALALYNEAKKAGLVDKTKPYFTKMREKICPDAEDSQQD